MLCARLQPLKLVRQLAVRFQIHMRDLLTMAGFAVQEIANDILGEQSPKRLFQVRGKLYELLTNCIPPELILRRLMLELVKKLDDELKHRAVQLAAFYEHRLQVGPLRAVLILVQSAAEGYQPSAAGAWQQNEACMTWGSSSVAAPKDARQSAL